MATLKDIANEVGVSVRTVSRALSDSGYVSAPVRERVLASATRLGYVPDPLARSLRLGRTQEVVVIAMTVDELHMARIAGLDGALREAGYSTGIQMTTLPDLERPESLVDSLARRRPAAVVIAAQVLVDPRPVVHALDAAGIRSLVMDTASAVPAVRIDRAAGVAEAVRYLAGAGRRHLAYVGPEHSVDRTAGFDRALSDMGLAGSKFAPRGSYRSFVRQLLADYPEVDAIQAYSDERALELLAGLHDAGVRVPDDVAIVGFDDRWAARYAWPPLTTVAQPSREIGEAAARFIVDESVGEFDVTLPTAPVIRESA